MSTSRRCLLTSLWCALGFASRGAAQQAPVVYVAVSPGSAYQFPWGIGPYQLWPSMNFIFGDPSTVGLSLTSAIGANGGTVSLRVVGNEPNLSLAVGGFDVYVRGGPGTPFHLQSNCTDTASATVNQVGLYEANSGIAGGNCAGAVGLEVLSFTGPNSLQKAVSNSGAIDGTTSGQTATNPAFPEVTYSYATSFGQWINVGGQNVGGSANNDIPYVGFASMDVNVSFTANIVAPGLPTLELCDDKGHCVSTASPTGDFPVVPNLIVNTGSSVCSYVASASYNLNLTARCVDATGSDVSCNVAITDTADATTGGHFHNSPPVPAGFSPDMSGLSVTSGSTGSSGLPFVYTPHAVSDTVTLTLTGTDTNGNSLVPASAKINVGVTGLSAMPVSPFYSLTGGGAQFPAHPNNHFGLPSMNVALAGIAQDFAAAFPGSVLSYNDMSLIEGGVFDLNKDWAPPHCGHRSLGGGTNNIDIALVPTAAMQKKLRAIIIQHGGRVCAFESNHWHVCF